MSSTIQKTRIPYEHLQTGENFTEVRIWLWKTSCPEFSKLTQKTMYAKRNLDLFFLVRKSQIPTIWCSLTFILWNCHIQWNFRTQLSMEIILFCTSFSSILELYLKNSPEIFLRNQSPFPWLWGYSRQQIIIISPW